MSVISADPTHALEELQNRNNRITSKRPFFASKLHKFKKMLKPLLKRMSHHPRPRPAQPTIEDLQNAMNEALECRLAEDIATSAGIKGDAIQTVVEDKITLLVVTRDSCVTIPAHFVATGDGFSWTCKSADSDICSREDMTVTSFQEPQQQVPLTILSC